MIARLRYSPLLALAVWLPVAIAMPLTADDRGPAAKTEASASADQDEAGFFLTGLPDLRRRLSLSPLQHAPWYAAEALSKNVLHDLWQRELPLSQWRQQLDNPETTFATITGDIVNFQQTRAQQWQHFLSVWNDLEVTLDSAQKESLRRYWRDWTVHCQQMQRWRNQPHDNSHRPDVRRPNGPPPMNGPGLNGSF